MLVITIVCVVIAVIAVVIAIKAVSDKKASIAKIGSAEEKAREIIDEAMKTAETKKREGLLEVKEEALRNKTLLEKMLPDCKIGIVCMNKNMQDNALYLELEENRIFTPTAGK